MVDIPTKEPESFVAGDTVKWTKSLADYKASDGWVLKYALRGAAIKNITATAFGDDHAVTITAATTTGYTAGIYAWNAYVEKDSERYTVDKGYLEVKTNLATATSITDTRLQLEADITAINGFLQKNYKYSSYSIAGRSLNNYPIAELFTLRDRLKNDLGRMKDAERIAKGLGSNRIIRVRMQ